MESEREREGERDRAGEGEGGGGGGGRWRGEHPIIRSRLTKSVPCESLLTVLPIANLRDTNYFGNCPE